MIMVLLCVTIMISVALVDSSGEGGASGVTRTHLILLPHESKTWANVLDGTNNNSTPSALGLAPSDLRNPGYVQDR